MRHYARFEDAAAITGGAVIGWMRAITVAGQ
jgi:hypothetical protein